MGIRIIEGEVGHAVLYCSTTMWAFGPLFVDREEAETFLLFVAARGVQDLRARGDREIEWIEFGCGDPCA